MLAVVALLSPDQCCVPGPSARARGRRAAVGCARVGFRIRRGIRRGGGGRGGRCNRTGHSRGRVGLFDNILYGWYFGTI